MDPTDRAGQRGLEDQVAVVTGAGRGIGRAIAVAMAEAGASVVAAARTRSDLDETVSLISHLGRRARAAAVDVTDRLAVERLARDVDAEMGHIDVLVNCAGSFSVLDPVWEVSPDLWWQDVTTNLFGTFVCCRSVLPGMIARRKGTIVNLSGGGVGEPAPYWSGYASSKTAIVSFTESLAREVESYGIWVYALGPGLVRTAMTKAIRRQPRVAELAPWFAPAFDQGATVSPQEAAGLAVRLVNLRDARMSGREFGIEDIASVENFAKYADTIAGEDLYTLRLRRPAPFDPDSQV